MTEEFIKIKRELLENEYANLNDMQKSAVFTSKGYMLILAGAGSGKTTTVVNKITYMIKYGDAYSDTAVPDEADESTLEYMKAFAQDALPPDDYIAGIIAKNRIKPYNILAFTFTNKAANEMKERIAASVGSVAGDMWIGTFHSMCLRILRRNLSLLPGYDSNFVIYDTADQKTLIKVCIAELNLDEKLYNFREIMSKISAAKDKLITPEEYISSADGYREIKIGEIYSRYQEKLRGYNALDFDDIINHTVYILKNYEDVRKYYTDKFRYVLVDEYQDTNRAQYELISLLSSGHGNLCVVGDDDQSIYGWRGADIQNIIDFEKNYPNCRVIKLEQNYRSTQTILDAANAVILNNENRKGKNLWTDKGNGEKISVFCAEDDRDEAEYVADTIDDLIKTGNISLSDVSMLYRTHAQSRIFEDVLVRRAIPYKIIGGVRFYERKEIKDILAYMRVLLNPSDDISLRRIINFPKRGIGDVALDELENLSAEHDMSFLEIIKSDLCSQCGRAEKKLRQFAELIDRLKAIAASTPPSELISEIMNATDMPEEYFKEGEIEGTTRVENIEELISVATELEEMGEVESLSDFLEYTSLITDTDVSDETADCVTLMTVHAAKGLEFPVVFLVGLEEGLFPKNDPNESDDAKIEEERRLCYVAITRAKQRLFISRANRRLMYGRSVYNNESRFICEIPLNLLEKTSANIFAKPMPDNTHMQKPKSFDFMNASYAKPKKAVNKTVKCDFKEGDSVIHKKFGIGVVAEVSGSSSMPVLTIDFEAFGRKNIIASAVEKLSV